MADEIEKKANRESARIRPLKLTFPTDARKPIIEDNADTLDDLPEANLPSKEISSPSLSEEAISESLTHEDEHEDKIASYTLLEYTLLELEGEAEDEDGITAFPLPASPRQEMQPEKIAEKTREEKIEDEDDLTAFPPPLSPKQVTLPDKRSDKKIEKIRVPLGRIASSDMDVLFSSRVGDSPESDMPHDPVDRRSVVSFPPAPADPSMTSPAAAIPASSARPTLRRIPASHRISETDLISTEAEETPAEAFTEDTRAIAVPVPKIPLRFKTLGEAMSSLRDLHPLPTETLFAQESYQFTWLSTQIRKIVTKTELQDFAVSLTQRDLSLLFSTLSQLKKRDETEPVQNLIRLRAGHCLYLYGWITFQYCYPRSTLARALADLCKILEDISFVKENAQDDDQRRIRSADSAESRMGLPEIDIGEGRVIWSRVPLISGIAFPNSRHFISDIANHIFESNISLEAFYRRYAIFPGLPLSDAIESRYKEKVTGDSQNPFLSSTFFDRFRN
ncbi:MAG: hypothetical protein GX939_05125 [Clostridiaceae bacterium]|jgi:hypothetical protein|nr:hypothetical protein [Clostridiaceae bacterium]